MKKLELIALLGFACVGGNLEETTPIQMITQKYSGDTEDYDVEAKENFIGERCIERIIVLKEKNKLHTSRNHVDYVRAIDRDCNDSIEDMYFRGPFIRSVNRAYLEQDILNAFYRVKFK